jgi:hypothetical protein
VNDNNYMMPICRAGNRRMSNGEQVNEIAGLATKRKHSADFTGYWQRHAAE